MDLQGVQTIRNVVLLAAFAVAILLVAVIRPVYPGGHAVHELIEWIGLVLIVICVLGRSWSSLYIAGRKNSALQIHGSYSLCRNPLYFFAILGSAGMGLQTGSIVLGLICGAIAAVAFFYVVTREEHVFAKKHGKTYRDYVAKVPRFIPRSDLWRDDKTLKIRAPSVLTIFIDAMIFLLSVPIAEGFRYLRELGMIPTLLVLP